MPFGTRVNFETAVIKDIYERLCWVYTTLRNTLVFDHKGEANHRFDISELSKGKIPYAEQCSKKPDYEQDSLIQDLRMKDILWTRMDCFKLGRDPSNGDLSVCGWRRETIFCGRHTILRSSV
jgi:hypothetical protein